jgi:hypothetical protein
VLSYVPSTVSTHKSVFTVEQTIHSDVQALVTTFKKATKDVTVSTRSILSMYVLTLVNLHLGDWVPQ